MPLLVVIGSMCGFAAAVTHLALGGGWPSTVLTFYLVGYTSMFVIWLIIKILLEQGLGSNQFARSDPEYQLENGSIENNR